MVSLLLRACLSDRDGPVVWRRVDSEEIERETLEACGFRATGRTIGYAVDAGAL
jgi:hypothetical protein